MSVNIKVLKAFLGKENPVAITIKGTVYKAIIDFGEIKLPKSAVVVKDFKSLEKEFDCVIKHTYGENGIYISVIPKFVLEYKMLSTVDENQQKRLAKWLKEKGGDLIRILLRGSSYV